MTTPTTPCPICGGARDKPARSKHCDTPSLLHQPKLPMPNDTTPPPCPFCGGSDVCVGSNETHDDYPTMFFAYCGQCGARGPECHVVTGDIARQDAEPEYEAKALERWGDRD